MSNSTNKKHSEQLATQLNAEDNHNSNSNSELVDREQLDGTPFWIIGNEDDGYKLIMGKYQLTGTYRSKDEIIEQLENDMWKMILNMILIVMTDAEGIKTIKDEFTKQKTNKSTL